MAIGRWAVALGMAVTVSSAFAAMAPHEAPRPGEASVSSPPAYDGRFTFVRLRQRTLLSDRPDACYSSEDGPGWHHDYPRAERNLLQILTQITSLDARVDTTLVLTADDPALLRYPLAYLTEAACWQPAEAEVQGLRAYLQKGGVLLADDLTFGGQHGSAALYQLARETITAHLKQVLPAGKLVPLGPTEPVFQTFFALDPQQLQQLWQRQLVQPAPPPEFWGIYEDNDPTKPLQVLVIYHLGIGDAWRYAPQGLYPVAGGNEAYKMGVNFVLYGLTH